MPRKKAVARLRLRADSALVKNEPLNPSGRTPGQTDPEHGVHRPRKPWPLSWILIIILTYILFQTAYFIFTD